MAEDFTKTVDYKGKTCLQPWKRYYFTYMLNHGLARIPDCLPANTTVTIRLHRAPSSFALLRMKNTITLTDAENGNQTYEVDYSFDENVVPITNPVLKTYFAYSAEQEQYMSRIKTTNMEIPFLDYVARRTVLDGGLSEYDINLLQGRMPKYIIFGLSTLERLSGSETTSLTKFTQGSLDQFDLIIGSLNM